MNTNPDMEEIYIYYHRFDKSMSSSDLTKAGLGQYFKDVDDRVGEDRKNVAATILKRERNKKPYFKECPDIFHNVSHSGGWWICAYGRSEMGLDLQMVDDRDRGKVAKRFLHPLENAWLQDKDSKEFFRLWAYNESYVKYTGAGLSRGLSYFSTVSSEREDSPDAIDGRLIITDLGVAGVCQQEIRFVEDDYFLVLTTKNPVKVVLRPLPHQIHFLEYKVKEADEDREVLSVLREEMQLTTRKIRALKSQERGILLDGERVTVRHKVRCGQLLKIMLDDVEKTEDHIAATKMPLEILYEDMDLLFVNKPAGVVSHPSLGHGYDSLANGVRAYLDSRGETCGIHLIGRLDKDTSGILGIAKNSVTKEKMIRMRQDGLIHKEYIALVEGHLPSQEGTIDLPMEEYRDPDDGNRLKMRRPSDASIGLPAVTHFQVLKEYEDASLVALHLDTGRMHQIRFHMASIGHPLLGDSIYGHGPDLKRGIMSTALHARSVVFVHPYTKKKIKIYIYKDSHNNMKEDNYVLFRRGY